MTFSQGCSAPIAPPGIVTALGHAVPNPEVQGGRSQNDYL